MKLRFPYWLRKLADMGRMPEEILAVFPKVCYNTSIRLPEDSCRNGIESVRKNAPDAEVVTV